LISNASKYAPNSDVDIRAFEHTGKIRITVSDTGPGIPPEHLKKLFTRFYRVPERSGGVRGTGLGLFICKQIIESHNGSIWVKSEVDKGTTFIIQLDKTEPIQKDVDQDG
jgi:signal transduction histidine kinase